MYFSRTFKALNFDFQIQGLSRTFKVRANPGKTWLRLVTCQAVTQTFPPAGVGSTNNFCQSQLKRKKGPSKFPVLL